MKKKKLKISPNSMKFAFPSKQKEILEIVNDPKKMQAVLELGRAAANVQLEISKSKSLKEWADKVIMLLPKNIDLDDDFIFKFKEFINEYTNKRGAINTTKCE